MSHSGWSPIDILSKPTTSDGEVLIGFVLSMTTFISVPNTSLYCYKAASTACFDL